MRLRSFASKIGVSYSTALRMFKRDEIPGAFKLPSGTIVVPEGAVSVLADRYLERCDNNDVGIIIAMLTELNDEQLNSVKNAIHALLLSGGTDVSD